MKRTAAFFGMVFLAVLGLAAAVWDGSAVAGGAGDFPDDGFYGACNSFPRDTSVTVTNLENGKTVTVTITRNVDNPGVFIALSPKAAAELGMHSGTASRIRAEALIASQAETSLPPTRAGETADPDYNPRIYVEREKAAVAAAAAAPSAPSSAPPAAATAQAAVAAASQAAPAAATASPLPVVTPPATVSKNAAPESVEVFAKVGEPKKQPSQAIPSMNEPQPSAAASAAAAAKPAAIPKPAAPESAEVLAKAGEPKKLPAQALPSLTEPQPSKASAVVAGVQPAVPETAEVLGGAKPNPRPSASSRLVVAEPYPPNTASALKTPETAEVIGGAKPNPRVSAPSRLVVAEPALPGATSSTAPATVAGGKAQGKASVDTLARPQKSTTGANLALAEPAPEFAPEELPDAVLSRVTAPTKVVVTPELAEAEAPKSAVASKQGLEAIALEKPSYAEAVEEAALAESTPPSPSEFYSADRPGKVEGEGAVARLDEAAVPGSPEALYSSSPAKTSAAMSELQVPDVPHPRESLAEARKAPKTPPYAALNEPSVPTPTESLAAGKPNAVAPGQAVAELAEPSTEKAAVAEKPTGPETATAVAAEKPSPVAPSGQAALQNPAVPSPTESIAPEHPATVTGGEKSVTLEPAAPRPPIPAAQAAPATVPVVTSPSATETKPAQPAAVATIKGPSPAGAAQIPSSIPILKGLAKGSFYVQIGVYGTNDALQSALTGFKTSSYPLAVEKLTTKAGSAAYRLFVGPLSRDESGLVLIRIRSLGFKDAYVRQGS